MKAYLEPIEIEKLEVAAKYLRDKLLIMVIYHVGCRVSEALALEVKDIDFNTGTITIQHLKALLRLSCPDCSARLGRSHSFCPKCGKKVSQAIARQQEHRKVRTLPVDDETLKVLKDYVEQGGPVHKGGKLLIFGINRHRAWQIIKECAERAGLPKTG